MELPDPERLEADRRAWMRQATLYWAGVGAAYLAFTVNMVGAGAIAAYVMVTSPPAATAAAAGTGGVLLVVLPIVAMVVIATRSRRTTREVLGALRARLGIQRSVLREVVLWVVMLGLMGVGGGMGAELLDGRGSVVTLLILWFAFVLYSRRWRPHDPPAVKGAVAALGIISIGAALVAPDAWMFTVFCSSLGVTGLGLGLWNRQHPVDLPRERILGLLRMNLQTAAVARMLGMLVRQTDDADERLFLQVCWARLAPHRPEPFRALADSVEATDPVRAAAYRDFAEANAARSSPFRVER
ncbi:MAG: hypothetical protein KC656_09335 [Myxococcales bacterium]|nr:hypothetical protein [Myxococcales bacterium]MCB9669214.1 hypothetical protein [Alphaproteobacteria bacterium]